MGYVLEQKLSKEEIKVPKKYLKKHLPPFTIRENKSKQLWDPILSHSAWLRSTKQPKTNSG